MDRCHKYLSLGSPLRPNHSDNLPYEKVGNNELVYIADEVPFEIPESWEWVRLKELCQLLDGEKRNNISYVVMDAKYLRGKTQSTFINEGKFVSAGEHMILVDGENSGEVFVAPVDGYMGSTFKRLWIAPILCKDYVLLFINLYRIPLKNRKTGAAIPHLNKNLFLNLLLPVPPLTEQKRIVEQYRTLNPLAEKYGCLKKDIEYLNTRFPDQLKKSILQEAIQGKLVPQDPNDEPASVLLERIRAEKQRLIKEGKIKKDKHESVIFRRDNSYYEKLHGEERCIDEELPFDIPDSWIWTRLNSLGYTQTGNTPSTAHPEYRGDYIPFITPGDIIDGSINYENQSLSEIGKELARVCPANSILQVCIGGSIGKAGLTQLEVAFNQQINSLTPIAVSSKYVFAALTSFMFIAAMKENAGGTATPILNRSLWDKMFIPLPPLDEQRRIARRIEELLSLINGL